MGKNGGLVLHAGRLFSRFFSFELKQAADWKKNKNEFLYERLSEPWSSSESHFGFSLLKHIVLCTTITQAWLISVIIGSTWTCCSHLSLKGKFDSF